eukprot:7495654-Karenia_brevis.AAC.1
MEPSMAAKLQEKIATWKDWEVIHRDFPVCKVGKCFNHKKKKIQLGVPRAAMAEVEGMQLNGAA